MVQTYKILRGSMLYRIYTIILFLALNLIAPDEIYADAIRDPRPNVIFILADDAGYGDFGAYGQTDILTPNIDKMAKEGLVFTDHYAGAPVCSPSRSCLMTGLHTGHTPIRGNKEVSPEGQHPLPANTFTVARMLQSIDVDTAVIGKWGLGYPESTGTPEAQGFDYFYGYNCQRLAHNYYPESLWENDQRINLDAKTYSHDLFTEKALAYLDDHQSKSFFLFLAYTTPHAALEVPDFTLYENKQWPESMKKYAAMISRMDTDVGKLLSKLEELQIEENTLVIFSSDNGPHEEGGADPSFFKSSGPFRGIKRELYEGGIRIPLIARWKGTITPDQKTDLPSAFWDFLPTVADLYAINIPEDIDGVSYLPTLRGSKEPQKKHEYLYWEFQENGGIQAIRLGKWKGIRKFVRLFPQGPIELYNLETDPGETKDVSKDNKRIVTEMSTIMSSARKESKDFPLVGKNPLRMGFENGWLFLVPLGLSSFLLGLFLKMENRVAVKNQFRSLPTKSKIILSGKVLSTVALSLLSIFSPIMVMSPWFAISVSIALSGIIGFIVSSLWKLKKDRFYILFLQEPLYKNVPGLFLLVFWIGLGSSILSWPFIILVSVWFVLGSFNHLIQRPYS
ncbi:hypothetical protein MASR2M78_19750 [Treponema sp.]